MKSALEKLSKKEYDHSYYENHTEEIKTRSRLYQLEHWEEHRQYSKKYAYSLKMQVLTHYSLGETPQCARCGIIDVDVLCIDHINGGGYQHRKSKGFPMFYRWLKAENYPDGFQVLCANCNLKKRIREDNKFEEHFNN